MDKCLQCGNELIPKEGKRKKKFCNDKCRSNHFQKNKTREKKYVQIKKYQKALDRIKELETNQIGVTVVGKNRPIIKAETKLPEFYVEPVAKEKSEIPPTPKREDFEDSISFGAAKSEWKIKYQQ